MSEGAATARLPWLLSRTVTGMDFALFDDDGFADLKAEAIDFVHLCMLELLTGRLLPACRGADDVRLRSGSPTLDVGCHSTTVFRLGRAGFW